MYNYTAMKDLSVEDLRQAGSFLQTGRSRSSIRRDPAEEHYSITLARWSQLVGGLFGLRLNVLLGQEDLIPT